MAVAFFYISLAVVWVIFFICAVIRRASFRHLMVAVTSIGYSLLYEITLGEYADLYHYINPEDSLLYMILASVLLYPVINVIYAMFLPEKTYPAAIYTAVWIVLMMAFELASMYTGTVVLTGWRIFPWSPATYIVTFLWVSLLFRYLKKRSL